MLCKPITYEWMIYKSSKFKKENGAADELP